MTEHKFTDEEIIKALEICAKNTVGREGYFTHQGIPLRYLCEDALDLINRQKAETAYWMDEAVNAKNEAVKAFAERLKQTATSVCAGHGMSCDVVYVGRIDNLVKEMTEDKT